MFKGIIDTTEGYAAKIKEIWTDGKSESKELVDELVKEWTDGSDQLRAAGNLTEEEIEQLDDADAKIKELLNNRRNGYLSEKELAELEELEKWRSGLGAGNGEKGYEEIQRKVQYEINRANALQQPVATKVYENAILAATQGYKEVKKSIDDMFDAGEITETEYVERRRQAAIEYAETIKPWYDKKLATDDMKDAADMYEELYQLVAKGDNTATAEFLEGMSDADKDNMSEYLDMLAQVEALLADGATSEDIKKIFGEDFDADDVISKLESIRQYAKDNPDLTGLDSILTSLGKETQEVLISLNFDTASEEWKAWAEGDHDAITTTIDVDEDGIPEPNITVWIDEYKNNFGVEPPDAEVYAWIKHYYEAQDVTYPDAYVEAKINAYKEEYGANPPSPMVVGWVQEYLETEDLKGRPFRKDTRLLVSGYDQIALTQFKIAHKDDTMPMRVALTSVDAANLDPTTETWVWNTETGQYEAAASLDVALGEVGDDAGKILGFLDEGGNVISVFIEPKVGTPEDINNWDNEIKTDEYMTPLGKSVVGFDLSPYQKILNKLQYYENVKEGGFWNWLGGYDKKGYRNAVDVDFSDEDASEIASFITAVYTALLSGEQVDDETLEKFDKAVTFIQQLQELGAGGNIIGSLENTLPDGTQIADVVEFANDLGEDIGSGIGEGQEGHDFSDSAETMISNDEEAIRDAADSHSPAKRFNPVGEDIAAGVAEGMEQYDAMAPATTLMNNIESALNSGPGSQYVTVGMRITQGMVRGIQQGQSAVVQAIIGMTKKAVDAAKQQLGIQSPSKVFRDEIGANLMKGIGEGVTMETGAQGKIVANAAKYLTEKAAGALGGGHSSIAGNSVTTNNNVSSNVTVNVTASVRSDNDIRKLAAQIARLTQRVNNGYGMLNQLKA